MRGFAPARRGPFVSAKGPKTIGARAWPQGGAFAPVPVVWAAELASLRQSSPQIEFAGPGHTQPARLNRYSHIMHDLAVQRAVLKRLDLYDEVIWDKHITLPEQDEKPDALMHSPKNYWVAFEYERWRKETKRIYLSFMNHARALIKRHYSGVYYLFDREEDLVYYQTLFAAEAWPEYHYNRKTGKITPAGTHFQPDAIERLRDCFLFIHESHTHTRDSLQKRGVG